MKYSCKFFLFFAVAMRANSTIRRGVTFLLLLIFLQQMGAGLFVHNLVHDSNKEAETPNKQDNDSKEINFACSCVDDFLIPYIAADEPPVAEKPNICTKLFDSYTGNIYFTSLIFSSLRGPPVFIA